MTYRPIVVWLLSHCALISQGPPEEEGAHSPGSTEAQVVAGAKGMQQQQAAAEARQKRDAKRALGNPSHLAEEEGAPLPRVHVSATGVPPQRTPALDQGQCMAVMSGCGSSHAIRCCSR